MMVPETRVMVMFVMHELLGADRAPANRRSTWLDSRHEWRHRPRARSDLRAEPRGAWIAFGATVPDQVHLERLERQRRLREPKLGHIYHLEHAPRNGQHEIGASYDRGRQQEMRHAQRDASLQPARLEREIDHSGAVARICDE